MNNILTENDYVKEFETETLFGKFKCYIEKSENSICVKLESAVFSKEFRFQKELLIQKISDIFDWLKR